jgi:transposase-like protein
VPGRATAGRRRRWGGTGSGWRPSTYPKEHWAHLRTTKVVKSPLAMLRLRTDAAKRFKRVDRITAVIWKMLMICEQRCRR